MESRIRMTISVHRQHRGRHAEIFQWAISAAYEWRYTSDILRLAGFTQYRRDGKTDTQTDTRLWHIPR